jgi:hypothetical protein
MVTIHVLPDEIFADSFESNNLTAWSQAIGNGLSVTSSAALVGDRGLAVNISDSSPRYLVDTTPAAEAHYRARFYFDPNSLPMGQGESHYIFLGRSGAGTSFMLLFRYLDGTYYLLGYALDDVLGYRNTAYYPLLDDVNFIEIEWVKASATTSTEGAFRMWINGSLKQALTALGNSSQAIIEAWLGPSGEIDTGTSGTYYFDDFVSNRESYIGGLIVGFSADVTSGDAPLAVQFTGTVLSGQPGPIYAWDFGDGNTSTEANPQHSYASAGVYDVSLTVTSRDYTRLERKQGYINISTPKIMIFMPVINK